MLFGQGDLVKRHLDHCIPLVSPWFSKIEGESHHPPRYPRAPGVLAVGLLEAADPSREAVFARREKAQAEMAQRYVS